MNDPSSVPGISRWSTPSDSAASPGGPPAGSSPTSRRHREHRALVLWLLLLSGAVAGVSQTLNVSVDGSRSLADPVTVTIGADKVGEIGGLGGTVCLEGDFACTGPGGLSMSECNTASSSGDECSCPDDCGLGGSYGALLATGCLDVHDRATFAADSEGELTFFVNGDCDPSNNSGQYSFSIEIKDDEIFTSDFDSGTADDWD